MASRIPPLISSSPPPLCECEDEDDDEFSMFTGVEDLDFTVCNSYTSRSNGPHDSNDIMRKNIRPVGDDVIGFGSCTEQDSTSQDSATDSGLCPDSEGMSPIPHSDEDKSDHIKVKLVNTNVCNRLCPNPSSDSEVLHSANNSLNVIQQNSSNKVNEFSNYTGLSTKINTFVGNQSLNLSCNILGNNIKEHSGLKNGEGQNDHSVLKELLENEGDDDFGNFEYACVVPEKLTRLSPLQDLNLNNNLTASSTCDNINAETCCDLSNFNFDVCKGNTEIAVKNLNNKEENGLCHDSNSEDTKDLNQEELKSDAFVEDSQVHNNFRKNHVTSCEGKCPGFNGTDQEWDIQEDHSKTLQPCDKQNVEASDELIQETSEFNQEHIEKTKDYYNESEKQLQDFNEITEEMQNSKEHAQDSSVLNHELSVFVCSEYKNDISEPINKVLLQENNLDDSVTEINTKTNGDEGDEGLFETQRSFEVTGCNIRIEDSELGEDVFENQGNCEVLNHNEFKKCMSENTKINEKTMNISNLSEDEFDDFQCSSEQYNFYEINTEKSSELQNTINSTSVSVSDGLRKIKEHAESENHNKEIYTSYNTEEILPVVNTDGEFESDGEFSNFADFSATNFSIDQNCIAQQESLNQRTQVAQDNGFQACIWIEMFPEENGNGREETEQKTIELIDGNNLWKKLCPVESTPALSYQWANSVANNKLLAALNIDSRNILFMPWCNPSVPRFAANLGFSPLEPVRAPEHLPSVLPPAVPPPTTTITEETVPDAHFDWVSSGLTNPLDCPDLAAPQKTHSTEAEKILSNLPNLSYMRRTYFEFVINKD